VEEDLPFIFTFLNRKKKVLVLALSDDTRIAPIDLIDIDVIMKMTKEILQMLFLSFLINHSLILPDPICL
jgi:hypothetical protein